MEQSKGTADMQSELAKSQVNVSIFTNQANAQALRAPCPFLEEQGCRVYQVRPIVCQFFPFVGKVVCNQRVITVVQCPGGARFTSDNAGWIFPGGDR